MNDTTSAVERVIGFDSHPDSFTAAVLRGSTPAGAIVEKTYNKLPLSRLKDWAVKSTTAADLFVLEASGNSFQVVRTLAGVGRRAKVLESCQMGKLKDAHANNDKISAVRIGKAYLAGTAKEVWVPDRKTQERRDMFHAYRKATKRTTQLRARLRSYLSDNGVRLEPRVELTQPQAQEAMRQARSWSARQWQLIEMLLLELGHAEQQRQRWQSLMAQEVLEAPELLRLVRLCGVREIVAFALGAFIGDIRRFSEPKKLVKYCGLDPAFDDSGEGEWSGGIGGHGNSHLRCLLVEAAQAIMRCSPGPLGKWGRKLLARKGQSNLAVAAVARKLTVAIWYLMQGRWTALEELDQPLVRKVGKLLSSVGVAGLKALGKERKAYRQEIYQRLKASQAQAQPPEKPAAPGAAEPSPRIYVLNPNQRYTPEARAQQSPGAAIGALAS